MVNINNGNQPNQLGAGGVGGNLTFGGAPGDQGQFLSVAGGNTWTVNGNTNLGPSGIVVISANGSNITLNGLAASQITGTATTSLVKQGGNNLLLGPAGVVPTLSSTFGGGITVMQGLLQANATATAGGGNVLVNQLGDNTITLVGGTLAVQVDGAAADTAKVFTFANNDIVVNGNSTITVNRNTGTQSNNTVAFKSLTISGQNLTINSAANTYHGQFNSVNLTNLATLTPGGSADVSLLNVTDNGAGLGIIKNGGGWLFFSGAPTLTSGVWTNADGSAAFSGGVYVNPGAALRFGTALSPNSTSQAGIGNIFINPGGEIQLQAATNINTAVGQKVDARSTPAALARVQLNSVFDPTSVLTQTSTGLLILPNTFNVALNQATIGDGSFQFAMTGDNTYTATTLGAGKDNVYRLGGNSQNFRITTTNNNVLTDVAVATPGVTTVGAARLQVGSLASNGGVFVFNNTNNYTGGTTIVRGAQANFNSGGVGSANTPFGSGQVDVFGTLLNNGGGFQNTAGTANNNVVVLHPGSQLTIDAVSGATNIWNDSAPIALNGATFLYQSSSGNAGQETVGAVTFANGSRISIINPGSRQPRMC